MTASPDDSVTDRLWSVSPSLVLFVVLSASPPSDWATRLGANMLALFLIAILAYHTWNVMKPW